MSTELPEQIPDDSVEAARIAKLRYVSDDRPGIRRERAVEGFRYRNPDGAVTAFLSKRLEEKLADA